MDKKYSHTDHEQQTYQLWEKSGAFKPEINPQGEPYCIIMPPPNANEALHIGHARFVSIEDALIRYARMNGKAALWLPGTDHAGIETQFVFEKKLAKKKKSRFDYDRDTLYQMIWDYVQEQGTIATDQMKSLGASADWDRGKFTLDPDIIKLVHQTFKRLHDDQLLYRGQRLVNYCTKCGTSFSELEVVHVERTDPLYFMKYGPFTLATVRPETKFGDTAVAVNPKDPRYQKYIGQTIEVQGLNGSFKLQVIADEYVDPEFGTGVVKITPAHDFNDFEVGQRHNLEIKQVIGYDGKLNQRAGKYQGLRVKKARQIIAQDLQEAGLLDKVDENYVHNVATCYKCKSDIEPLPIEQWFIKVRPLADKALAAVQEGETKFVSDQYRKIYRHWLLNLKDWNISRQIVWGIRIPAWRCLDCEKKLNKEPENSKQGNVETNNWIITDGQTPTECPNCQSSDLEQDTDTFDTWFSSGQWPCVTLQALDNQKPETSKLKNFETFYPTSVMETGYDILPFWVMRMMMLGIYATGQVPFRDILLHGMVRDGKGLKISKSKGNVINPLEWTAKYGTDALRFGLIYGGLIHSDLPLAEDKVRGMRNFANKLWNIGRFLDMSFTNVSPPPSQGGARGGSQNNKEATDVPFYTKELENLQPEDNLIIKQLNELITDTTRYIDNYQLNEATQAIYDFTWHHLADEYIEAIKNRVRPSDENVDPDPVALSVLRHTYLNVLKLLHPFMPFVTETIWQQLKYLRAKPDQLLITAPWPKA